jgi:iron complex transport system permease protein
MALASDILAQLPGTGVLPLNAMTAIFGAPVVIFVLVRGNRQELPI